MKYLITALFLVVAGCSQPLKATDISSLVSGCATAGGTAAQCDCLVAEIQGRISAGDMDRHVASIAAGGSGDPKVLQAVVDSSKACKGR